MRGSPITFGNSALSGFGLTCRRKCGGSYLSIDYCDTTVLRCSVCHSTALTSEMFHCGYYVQIHLFPRFLRRQKSLLWSLPAYTALKTIPKEGGSCSPLLICVDKQGSKHCCHQQPFVTTKVENIES